MIKNIFIIGSILLVSSPVWGVGEPPRVVVSIKPIHALVAGVMHGVAQPQLLLQGGGSPHGYVLRPSQARSLSEADLVVWVGHTLESFLEKPLETLAADARSLELMETLAPQLLPQRRIGNWLTQEHSGADQAHSHKEGQNPHLWLDPRIAQQIVVQLIVVLSEIDPENTNLYQANGERLIGRLSLLHQQLQLRLAAVKMIPYLVFHDAYPYFEAAYGLNAVGSISIDPERKAGIKRILAIREDIVRLNARAVFSEPQFEPRLVTTIVEGTGAAVGELDPLGTELPQGEESYFLLLNALADNLLKGLDKK